MRVQATARQTLKQEPLTLAQSPTDNHDFYSPALHYHHSALNLVYELTTQVHSTEAMKASRHRVR